jgi:hypothetical protein
MKVNFGEHRDHEAGAGGASVACAFSVVKHSFAALACMDERARGA